jgi:pimeloyl-ACP methyl ester carboxylesterase
LGLASGAKPGGWMTEKVEMPVEVKQPWFKRQRKPRKKITVKTSLIYCFNLYLCFLLCGIFIVFGIRDKIALYPMQNTEWKAFLKEMPAKLQVETKELMIPGPQGHKLAGLLIKKPGSKYIYLVSHGNAGNLGYRLGLASFIVASGQSVFLYDYQGYGESQGLAKLANLIPDGLSAFDYLVGPLGYKPDQVILYGESIGCGVTTGIMRERKARAVVLQSPFTSLMAAGKDKLWQLKIFPDWICPEPHLDNLSAVKRPHPPLLFIHGDQDTILPVRYSRTMFAAALEPKRYYEVKGAGHNDVGFTDLAGFRGALVDFVASFDNVSEK